MPRSARPALRRPTTWIGLVLLALVVFLLVFDWNWLKGPLERAVAQKTQRAFHIEGNLDVKLLRKRPTVTMERLTFANASWGREPLMARAERVEVSFSIPAALHGRLLIPALKLVQPDASLERNADGERNWVLAPPSDKKAEDPPIQNLVIDRGRIAYLDAIAKFNVEARIATETRSDGQPGTGIVFDGHYHDTPFEGEAHTVSVLRLQETQTPTPLRFFLKSDFIRIDADGSVTDLAKLTAADVAFKIAGSDLAKLHPTLPLPLPTTKPYSVEGRLKRGANQWTFTGIQGRIGGSDIHGDASYLIRQPRPRIDAKLASKLLDLDDLGPLIGVKPPPAKVQDDGTIAKTPAKKQKTPKDPNRKVLPAAPFNADKLGSIDADVTLDASRVKRPDALAIDDFFAHLVLLDGNLKLDPLRFGYAGGNITSAIGLDSRQKPYAVSLQTDVSRIRLDQLFPTVDWSKNSVGRLGGRVNLKTRGNSVATMLANADGRLDLITAGGEFSNILIEAIGLDGAELIKYLIGGDRRTGLRCGVFAFDVDQGKAASKVMVFDTDDTRIDGHGTIDFAKEALQFEFDPKPKDVSFAVLRAPLYVEGTFGAPSFDIDRKVLAARGAAAVGLGLLTPFAALIPLIETGPGEDANCQALLKAERKR